MGNDFLYYRGRGRGRGRSANVILSLYPAVYYDIKSTVQSGGKITQWNDLSGNGYHAVQGTDASRMKVSNTGDSAYKGNYTLPTPLPINNRSFSFSWVSRRVLYETTYTVNQEGLIFNLTTGGSPPELALYVQGVYGFITDFGRSSQNLPLTLFNYDYMPVTYTSSATGINVYIGGVNVYSSATPNANFSKTITQLFRSNTETGTQYAGAISSLAYWDRALTAQEVGMMHAAVGVSAIGKTPICCIGDSITVGIYASTYEKTWWYQALDAQGRVGCLVGGSGYRVLNLVASDSAHRIGYGPHTRFVFFLGTNDLATGRTFAQLRDDTIFALNALKTKVPTAKILMVTMLPRLNGTTTPTVNFETDRQLYNQWIRNNAGTYGYAVADVGNDADMGQAGQTGATYYIDSVHPNDAGYAVLAGYINAGLAAMG